MIDRRCFLGLLLASGCSVLASCAAGPARGQEAIPLFTERAEREAAEPDGGEGAVRVAFAALVSPQESFHKYQNLVAYLEERLGCRIEVVRRQTYREVNEMLGAGEVDFGFICALSYVMGLDAGTHAGIAAPVIGGSSFYRSYLVCRSDSGLHLLEDLAGRTFAFTDPLSYTGRLSMLKLLHDQAGADEDYFREVFYTYSHDSSVHAVHLGIVDAACVDGLVFDELAATGSDLVANVQVIHKGPVAGMPPVVASVRTDDGLKDAFQGALLAMEGDARGAEVLSGLGYDRFEVPENANYEVIREALQAVGEDAFDESGAAARGRA